MGKSLKNAVSPDEICDEYGADTLRVYEMSMGPLDTSRPWATKDVVGAQRFLQRAWRLIIDESTGQAVVDDAVSSLSKLSDADRHAVNRAIAGVHEDYSNLHNNTAVAKLIEYVNYLTKAYGAADAAKAGAGAAGGAGVKGGAASGAAGGAVPRAAVEPLALMLSPVAPHLAEELWARLKNGAVQAEAAGADTEGAAADTVEADATANTVAHATEAAATETVAYVPFPEWEEDWLVDDQIEMPVQVMGKVRSRIMVATDASREDLEAAALDDDTIKGHIEGKQIVKIIVVPGKMINIVAK